MTPEEAAEDPVEIARLRGQDPDGPGDLVMWTFEPVVGLEGVLVLCPKCGAAVGSDGVLVQQHCNWHAEVSQAGAARGVGFGAAAAAARRNYLRTIGSADFLEKMAEEMEARERSGIPMNFESGWDAGVDAVLRVVRRELGEEEE